MIAAARGALGLRQVALATLAGHGAELDVDASAEAWRVFLATERCALPLLAAAGAPAPRPLRDAAAHEGARVLAARAQAAALGRAAAERGIRLVLLKGTVELFEPGPGLALGDLDVLVEPGSVEAARSVADALGYEDRPDGRTVRHDPVRPMPGGVPLELHVVIDKDGAPLEPGLLGRARPIPGAAGLVRLAPTDHAWHVLLHGTVDHLHRRGRIRDLLLLARVLRRHGPVQDLAVELEARARALPSAAPVLVHLRMAVELAEGRTPEDAFRAEAAALYLAWAGLDRGGSLARLLLPTAADAPAALLAGGPEVRDLWRQVGRFANGTSPYAGLAGVERSAPGLGRGMRLLGRTVRIATSLAGSALITPVARRLAAES